MPDKNTAPNSNSSKDKGDNSAELSEMIHSAKKNIDNTPQSADKPSPADKISKPDVSFAKDTSAKPSGASAADTKPKPKNTAPDHADGGAPKRPAPPPRPAPPKRKPPQRTSASANGGKAPNAHSGGQPRPAGQRPAPQQGGKKPAVGEHSSRPVQGGKKPAAAPKAEHAARPENPQRSTAKPAAAKANDKPVKKPAEPEIHTAAAVVSAEEKKSGMSAGKKRAATIAGLVVGLVLLLAAVVVLLFHHYADMFDRNKKDIHNSEAPTYSDVDFSRDDTMDTVTANEKLKELQGRAEKISDKDVMNVMLIGEDLRDTSTGDAGNTDVMMVISVNKKDKTITMTSVMRDCYVYLDCYGYSNRINAAYWHGGIDLTKTTIENYLGLKIDRYVLVNFRVFIDIVDTLGGLDLTVSDEEANGLPGADPNGDNTRGMQNPLDEQNKYLGNKKGTDYIKKGGDLHLNGNQSLAYARLRHVGNSDYERTARQRRVIKEMIKKSKKLSIIDMDKLANKIFPQIETDVTEGEMAQLLIEMLDYRNYKVQEFRVPMDGTYTNEVISGMDVLNVDFYANSEALKKKVYGSIKIDEEGNEAKQTIE